MKVKATYRMVFNVTRELDVDEEAFEDWAARRYGAGFDRDLAIAGWLDGMDTEFNADVFEDFRMDKPLPNDFEFQYSEVEDVTVPGRTDTGVES